MTQSEPRPSPSPKAAPRKGRRAQPRRWLPYVLGVALLALIIAGFRPRPTPVETTRITRGPLRATIDEEGRTRVRHRFVVSAPVSGQLRRTPLKAGAQVRAGETLVGIIDPIRPAPLDARTRSLVEARREAASANVDKARTAHRFAATDLKRAEELFAKGSVSQQQLESAQWREIAAVKELTAAESALREVEAELAEFDTASWNLRSTNGTPIEIPAPADGTVLQVFEENARVVAAGTPLLEIGDPTDLEVVVEVLSRDGATIRPGALVELLHWGAPEPLQAKVRLVEPAAFTKVSALGVEEQRVNVIADILTPPEARPGLGDQFRVEARIVAWEVPDVLKAPAGALFRKGPNWSAFVVEDGRARLRRVEVGRTTGAEMEILGGVDPGAEVILYPGDRIHDSIRVTPVTIEP